NSDSELKYKLYDKRKEMKVFLDGEAWFNVTENPGRVFTVHTPYYDVCVTGTKFNVKAYREDNEIVTTLEHGSVFIPSNERFKMKSGKFLLPGEQLIYNREKHSISKNKVEISIYSAWKENKLIFINMSLKELIIMLERKYGVDIEVADTSIFKYHYDGTIRNESILEIMDLLQLTLPIQYEIVDNTVKIKRKEAQ
ncbi:MAG: FecR family protein, partial [Bacteroidales bacterium]